MTESIFLEDPIEFYSQRMKNTFAPPDFRMSMCKPKPKKVKGKDLREMIEIDGLQMVVPNSYEPEKWAIDSIKALKDQQPKIPVK